MRFDINEDYARKQGNPIFADLISFTSRDSDINIDDYSGDSANFKKDIEDAIEALYEFSGLVQKAFMQGVTDEHIIRYLDQRFSGRLNYEAKWEYVPVKYPKYQAEFRFNGKWIYTAGQNYPTEFRWAAVETLKNVVDYVYLLTMNDKDKEEK